MAGQEPDVGLASLSSTNSSAGAESATAEPAVIQSTDPDKRVAEEAWFRQVFADTYQPLVAYTRRRTIDASEADDIVSEVFAIAWRRRSERETDRPALPWLYGIAANVARNHWRSSGRRLRLVDHLEAQPRTAEVEDPADRSASTIREALSRLSFDDQEVLRLVAWEGLGHAEVAEVLGCSTNAVGIRVHRARQRLEQQMNDANTIDDGFAAGRSTSEEETS